MNVWQIVPSIYNGKTPNMKYSKLLFFVVGCLFFFSQKAAGQITLTPSDTAVCKGTPLDIKGSFSSDFGDITIDDVFGSVVNIGFDFVFYGEHFNKCVISANNFLTFDTSLANSSSSWVYSTAKNSNQLDKVIMFPFQDVNMGLGTGTISYQTMGTAPNRVFIVEFCQCPLFSCTDSLVTNQVILYEGSNIIEMHITSNSSCLSWQSGTAIQGLMSGTLSDLVPGRDVPNSPWSATNDARRFIPDGTTSYTIDSIPYDPIPIIPNAKASNITWYEEGNPAPIATDSIIHVTADPNINYYVATITGQNGCTGNSTVTFRDTAWVHMATKYDTTNITICEGETYNFLGRQLYQTGQYDTLFTSAAGCDSFVTLNLTVNPLPNVSMKVERELDLCEGDSVRLAIANPESTTNYQWTKDGATIQGANESSLMVHGAGTYVLLATTNKGCKDSTASVTVDEHERPVAQIAPLPDEIMCAYDTLQLSVEQPEDGSSYIWEPSKPFRTVTGNEAEVVKGIFLQPTQVTLTMFNKFGCSDKDTVQVLTKPCCEVFLPNAFSPNGDGKNDYFLPRLQNGQVLTSLKIFNRLGQLVYNNRNPKTGWDGTFENGKPAASDTYMYMIEYTCSDGKLYHDKGSLTLIR